MVEVTLYTRRGCTLCEKAKAVMLGTGLAVHIDEVDIDRDEVLRERYTNDVPVIFIGGVEAFRHRVDPETFRRMIMPALANEKCVPCRGGVPSLKGEELHTLMNELGGGWRVIGEHHLDKEFTFPDFAQALAFVNRIGALADEQGHHPDITLAWGRVRVMIWTHKIEGLTRSDFILAAKIDELPS